MSAGDLACRLVADPTAEERKRLRAFFMDCSSASYLQSPLQPEVAPKARHHRYAHLLCESGGELVGASVVRFTRLAPGSFLAALPRGPVFRDLEQLEDFLPDIKRTLARASACTVLMGPRWEDEESLVVEEILARHEFTALDTAEQPYHVATGLVDLRPPEDDILGGFKTRCRRQIRAAARKGLVIRAAGNERDVERFEALFASFAREKGYEASDLPSVVDQWRLVREFGGCFLLAELEGELVGGHLVMREGERAFWMTLASASSFPTIPRSYSLLWEAMREMKKQGCLFYDMAGLPPEEPRDEGERNRMQFKSAFRPRRVRLVRLHAAPLSLLGHTVLFRARQAYRRSNLPSRVAPLLGR